MEIKSIDRDSLTVAQMCDLDDGRPIRRSFDLFVSPSRFAEMEARIEAGLSAFTRNKEDVPVHLIGSRHFVIVGASYGPHRDEEYLMGYQVVPMDEYEGAVTEPEDFEVRGVFNHIGTRIFGAARFWVAISNDDHRIRYRPAKTKED